MVTMIEEFNADKREFEQQVQAQVGPNWRRIYEQLKIELEHTCDLLADEIRKSQVLAWQVNQLELQNRSLIIERDRLWNENKAMGEQLEASKSDHNL